MKLSHLSLAIFSAIALAACGGSSSGSDHTTPEQDHGTDQNQGGNTDQNTDDQNKEEEAQKDEDIVDPTKDKVVDAIALAETSTTASQQYIRGKSSIHDRRVNPSDATPASATALSGITLDVQNPHLTNIVIGRIEDKNAKGEDVKVAQFAGSMDSTMRSLRANPGANPEQTLQDINTPNALVDGRFIQNANASAVGWTNKTGYVAGALETITLNPLFGVADADAQAFKTIALDLDEKYVEFLDAVDEYNALAEYNQDPKNTTKKPAADVKAAAQAVISKNAAFTTALGNYKTAFTGNNINSFAADATLKLAQDDVEVKRYSSNTSNALKKYVITDGHTDTAPVISLDKTFSIDGADQKLVSVPVSIGPNTKYLTKYGYGAYFYAVDGNPNFQGDWGWGDRVTPAGVVGNIADNTPAGQPTHGLVGIYNQNNNTIVRGADDNNIRTSRIFGHYYIDPLTNPATNKLFAETDNSWQRPVTFVTGVDQNGTPDQYGFGAESMRLDHVQYGRVTANIDDFKVANRAATNGWLKVHQNVDNRDPEKLNDADDFYFYRGTGATTIKQMAALPTDGKISYQGHALMYGIDNKFHGAGLELPNAFGNTNSYGLGNFVEATLDMGAKKFEGTVYNSWHSKEQKTGQNDTLVNFAGDVTGNTVIGHATRAYVKDDKPADLRASFFGPNANEVGGSFNSVVRQDPFGPIGWGGVFGAQRTASGGNSWLVSSEQK